MAGKAEGLIQDAKAAGIFAKNAGSNVVLSICIIVLTISLVVSVVTAKVGADRYTGADHKAFVVQIQRERSELWKEQYGVNKSLANRIESMGINSYRIREDVAVTKTKVTNIEQDIAEIKEILLRSR